MTVILPVLLIAVFVGVDQGVKLWSATTLKAAGSLPGISGIFRFTYTENRGAAFSSFQGMRIMLVCVTAAALVLIIYILRKKVFTHIVGRLSLYLIIAGAIGNLIDRIRLGYVIDMIDLTFVNFAIFNIADCCVTVGAVLLVVYVLFLHGKKKQTQGE